MTQTHKRAWVSIVLWAGMCAIPATARAAACDDLASLPLPQGSVTSAQEVTAGTFTPAGRAGGPTASAAYARLAPFCRVAATLKPGPQSNVTMEAWLPVSGWNGKLQVVGNGGFAGTLSYPAMATALAAGYAAASTDTGHTGPSSEVFATRDVLLDFAHRAVHETTVAAKRLVDRYYGRAPVRAYFNGCSTGGRQALTEAQRYPDDFDGIVAGAPANYTSKQAFGQIWVYQATAEPERALSKAQQARLHEAVLTACDALDGARDGVLENPLACRFDPHALACAPGVSSESCLTTAQVEGVRRVYAGASNPRTGEPIFPGLERGSELGWLPEPVGYAVDYFKYLVFADPAWTPAALNYDTHVARAGSGDNLIFDVNDANLSPFTSHGGRLLMYQGWAEPGIPPRNIVSYYERVQKETKDAADHVRLFMVPGMGHCGGGDGTSTFDMVAALDRWFAEAKPPASIPASRVRNGQTDRTRPLCPWPQIARYKGTGNLNDANSFECGRQSLNRSGR